MLASSVYLLQHRGLLLVDLTVTTTDFCMLVVCMSGRVKQSLRPSWQAWSRLFSVCIRIVRSALGCAFWRSPCCFLRAFCLAARGLCIPYCSIMRASVSAVCYEALQYTLPNAISQPFLRRNIDSSFDISAIPHTWLSRDWWAWAADST